MTNSTFWSLMIIAGVSPWIIFCIIGNIMSHEKVSKKHKQYMMVILGFMIAIYFITMLLTAASGIHVYLYSSPGYIGVPQIIIIPSLLFYMKQVNIAKKFIRLINPVIIILYIKITVSLVILASYVVWMPTTYKELLYKSNILLGCAWYFAWLAAVVICLEMFFMYSYTKYTEVENINIKSFSIEPENSTTDIDQTIIQNKINVENSMRVKKKYVPVIGHYLSLITNLTLVSWLSMSNSSANITILALITIFPVLGIFSIRLQGPFNQLLISRNK